MEKSHWITGLLLIYVAIASTYVLDLEAFDIQAGKFSGNGEYRNIKNNIYSKHLPLNRSSKF